MCFVFTLSSYFAIPSFHHHHPIIACNIKGPSIRRSYTFQLYPQLWHIACFVTLLLYFLGLKIFMINQGIVKNIHIIGSNHQPINIQYTMLFFFFISETIWIFTFSLLHFEHIISNPSLLECIFYVRKDYPFIVENYYPKYL